MSQIMTFSFAPHEIWIMVIGAVVCSSCGLLGCFLILKRQAMMSDAISHAVLPGIVIAVMITGHLNSYWVLLGAGLVGICTPILTDLLRHSKTLHEDSSMGIVFTALFALGVVLINSMGNIDLDPDCILFGEIAMAPFDMLTIQIAGEPWTLGPHAFVVSLVVLLLNLIVVGLFYKEIKLTIFDPGLADTMGLHPYFIHYLIMAMVAITTISAFESVGAVLVVATFIAPGATAYLLTDRLGIMLVLAILHGILSSVLGYCMTIALGGNISIAGSICVVAGGLFMLAFVFSPRHGLIVKWRLAIQAKK